MRTTVLRLIAEHGHSDTGNVRCEVCLGQTNSTPCILQWRRTGNYGRKLIVVSRQIDDSREREAESREHLQALPLLDS